MLEVVLVVSAAQALGILGKDPLYNSKSIPRLQVSLPVLGAQVSFDDLGPAQEGNICDNLSLTVWSCVYKILTVVSTSCWSLDQERVI